MVVIFNLILVYNEVNLPWNIKLTTHMGGKTPFGGVGFVLIKVTGFSGHGDSNFY